MNLKKYISENFQFGELIGWREDNIPNHEELINMCIVTHRILQPLRNKFGKIRINSGFRNEALNKSVGGVSTSQHLKGEAFDIVPLESDIKEVFDYIIENFDYDQVILEKNKYSKWIHVSYKLKNNRMQKMTAVVDNSGTHYSNYEKV